MALAYDAATSGAGTSLTHICTGSNLMLVGFTATSLAINNNSTLSYNGVAMTFIGNAVQINNSQLRMFILANPSTGSNTLSATGANVNRLMCVSISGAATIDGGIMLVDNQIAGSSPSGTITTQYAGSIIVFAAADGSSLATITSGTGTIRATTDGDPLNTYVGCGTQTTTVAGNYTVDANKGCLVAVEVIDTTLVSTTYPTHLLLTGSGKF